MNIHPIRIANEADAPSIIEIYSPFVLDTTITFETKVPSVSEMAHRINSYLTLGPWLVSECDGQITGYAYASAHRSRTAYQWSIELSVYIHEDHRGKGLASRLYHCALEILHLQGYCTVLAGITQPNEPSNLFHQSIGFKLIGNYANVGYKHGGWCDVQWYELSLNRMNLPPKPIYDLKTLNDSGRLGGILEYHNSVASIENR